MATVSELMAARTGLVGISDSPALDVAVLLSHCLQRPREFLYAHPDYEPGEAEEACFNELLTRRRRGEPVAYLTGWREFWSLPLTVTGDALIPRPDTECLVELALELMHAEGSLRVLDLGTGTGAIALALASERPRWQVVGVDLQPAVVALARDNAQRLALGNVRFLVSDWFAALAGERFDLIVTNPPYVAPDDPHLELGDVRFEPRSALVAGDSGLADIERIVDAAPGFLCEKGRLLVEHGSEQGGAVRSLMNRCGFVAVDTVRDYGGRERVTHAQMRVR